MCPNCTNCVAKNGCASCKPGFLKQEDQFSRAQICLPCSSRPECAECDGYKCTKCKPFFYFPYYQTPIGARCQECDIHCADCRDLRGCVKCHPNFFLQPLEVGKIEYKCTGCSTNCKTCVDLEGCAECKPGFYPLWNGNLLAYTCASCPSGCKICSSWQECLTCADGLLKDGDSCKALETK